MLPCLEAEALNLRGYAKCLFLLAPRAGFEPATNRLTAGCSTAELPGNNAAARAQTRLAYNKAAPALKAGSKLRIWRFRGSALPCTMRAAN